MEGAVGHLARLDQLAMERPELQAAEQVGGLVERAVRRRERAADLGRGVVALVADPIDQEVDALLRASSFPRWKLSEKMMRAQRCIRQKSMPTRFSGDFAKPRSQSRSSQ